MATNKYVGQRLKRTEDPRLIKGLAHYVDVIRLPDAANEMACMQSLIHFSRAPMPRMRVAIAFCFF